MKTRGFFWGSAFVTFGVLLLLIKVFKFDFVDSSIHNLWPLIIVLIGINLFNIPIRYKRIVSSANGILFAAVIISSIYSAGNKFSKYVGDFDEHFNLVEFDDKLSNELFGLGSGIINFEKESKFDFGRIEINAGSGSLMISGSDTSLLTLGTNFESPIVSKTEQLKQVKINVDLDNQTKVHFNDKDVDLGPATMAFIQKNIYWDMEINIGAGNLKLDLSENKINKLDINSGASKIELKLGDVENKSSINFRTGASQLVIWVPDKIDFEVVTNSFIHTTLQTDFIVKENGNYAPKVTRKNMPKVIINIESGISKLDLKRLVQEDAESQNEEENTSEEKEN